ncbi:Coenzyme F420 hydrogenase/dehydrogenase, beta subunit C-terminal domain [Desulfobacula sp.]|uniref:Coenzyme F420 hydrogenase/dehydrogenase, beta subunit C-terminal domain n=1 Tax=Desulfobacula sp. TaxID=2593537 RepID=UPI00260B36D5|nr:Coenzyme F420 hydrogenase/dehydrogenase, beta subunit C-terminal domain [Desulfobacula sp.]
MKIEGPKELTKWVQMTDKCCGCGACINLCPYFKQYLGNTVQVFECDLETGRCHAYCPKIEVDYAELSQKLLGKPYQGLEIGQFKAIKAARAGGALPEQPYQGGGTVSAVMAFGLAFDYFDAAVLTDSLNGRPMPRIVTRVDEVLSCAGSKFTAAPTVSALNQAIHEGYRKIGMVGTPCQMTAIAQMNYNQLDIEAIKHSQIFTVGLFCNWALSPTRFVPFLEKKCNGKNITGMDIPPPPADMFVVKTPDEKIEIPLKDIRPYIDQSCFNCIDLTSEWADISVGMFEGRPGWNTLLIRSDKGLEMVEKARESGYLIVEDMPEDTISHLKQAARKKKQRALRVAKKQNELNTSPDKGRSSIILPDTVIDQLMK